MSEANKALVRRFYDAANRGALDDFDDFVAPDFIDHNALPGQSPGVQGLKEGIGAFRAGFPDIHATIMDLVAEGDKVVVRTAAHGTHTGPLLGVPPTGKGAEFKIALGPDRVQLAHPRHGVTASPGAGRP